MGSITNPRRSDRKAAAWGEPGAQALGNMVEFQEPRSGGTPRLMLQWQWWALVPLALACAGMFAPFLLLHGLPIIGAVLERGFALVCHQRPERSLWIFGGSVAICSRCLGIYLGATLGLLFRTARTIALRLLLFAAALNLLDAATELAGLHGNWLAVRFVLGLILGAAAGQVVRSAMANGSSAAVRPPHLQAPRP
jgi:uncharacterized membrane protein